MVTATPDGCEGGPFLPIHLPEQEVLAEWRLKKILIPCTRTCPNGNQSNELEVTIVHRNHRDHINLEGRLAVDTKSGSVVWDGGFDLAQFLAGRAFQHQQPKSGMRVLELGAGHGLPGIVAALCHGARVDFHDRSPEVLQTVTAANAAANGLGSCGIASQRKDDGSLQSQGQAPPRFLAGDWSKLHAEAEVAGLSWDAIIAAEAIYRPETYADLAALMDRCLAPAGVAWFAGKRFYFGCGGGTASFASFLRDRGFRVDTEVAIEDGRSNVREILRVVREGHLNTHNAKEDELEQQEQQPQRQRQQPGQSPEHKRKRLSSDP